MYLDPAFGGMILQVVIALAVTGGVVVFGMRRKIKALFKKDGGKTAVRRPLNGGNGEIVDMMGGQNNDSKEAK